MATRTMTTTSTTGLGYSAHDAPSSRHSQPRRPSHHRTGSTGSSAATSSTVAKVNRQRSKERSHANLTALHALEPAGSSPEDDHHHAAAGRIGPKRKSKVGISGMGGVAGDGLKRSRHDRNKGSTASLKALGIGAVVAEDRPRKTSGRDRAKLAAPEAANEDDWVSASGGESASQTPNVSAPGSPKPAPGFEPPQPYGTTPTASSTASAPMTAQLSSTPKQTVSAPASPPSRPPRVDTSDVPPKSAPLPTSDTISSVPFPTSTNDPISATPTSPVHAPGVRPRGLRKASTASVASRMSIQSLRQPMSPITALAPQLVTASGKGSISATPIISRPQSVAGPGQTSAADRRVSTSSLDTGDLSTRLREIGGMQSGVRPRIVSSESTRSFSNLARLSGNFGSSIRGLLSSTGADGTSSPNRGAPASRQQSGALDRSGRRLDSTSTFISKFISPSDLSPPIETATIPEPAPRTTSTGNVKALSRTSQRLLMQRDQPFMSNDRISPPENANSPMAGRSALIPPMSASTSPTDVAELNLPSRQLQCLQQQRQWAKMLCREVERVDREHECVLRHRDPAGESFARVLAKRQADVRGRAPAVAPAAAKGNGRAERRPDSLQRSHTTR